MKFNFLILTSVLPVKYSCTPILRLTIKKSIFVFYIKAYHTSVSSFLKNNHLITITNLCDRRSCDFFLFSLFLSIVKIFIFVKQYFVKDVGPSTNKYINTKMKSQAFSKWVPKLTNRNN